MIGIPIDPRVQVGEGTRIGEFCVFGAPREDRLRGKLPGEPLRVHLGKNCLIASFVILHEGVLVEDDVVVEDRVRVGYDARIGVGARLGCAAVLGHQVVVGAGAWVGGVACDGAVVGERARVLGELRLDSTARSADAKAWAAPQIDAEAVVDYGARVIGSVRVGRRSYVAAGALVTRDVPAEHVATGINRFTPAAQWQGQRLQELLELGTGQGQP